MYRAVPTLAVLCLACLCSPALAQQASGDPTAAELQALREELQRARAEAADLLRLQEERIRALEESLAELERRTADQPPPGAGPVTIRPGFAARVYGFTRLDADLDTRRMSGGPHLPFWVLSPDDPRSESREDGSLSFHPRLLRLGVDLDAPPVAMLGEAALSGKVEVDFFNILPGRNSATSNSRQVLRMRHGYGRLDRGDTHLLFGQAAEVISPLYPSANPDVGMWQAGNLGDRRPQLRFGWEPPVGGGNASLVFALGSTSAVDGQDMDGNLIVDGEQSRRPALQARAALRQPSWVAGQNWELGFWGHDSRLRVDTPISGHRRFQSQAVGFDLQLPLVDRVTLRAEGWTGKALGDVRGGIGQSINSMTGREIRARGGWAELLFRATDNYTIGGGFGVDSPRSGDVVAFGGGAGETLDESAVGRTLNQASWIVNRVDLGGGLVVGADWMLFRTKFRGLSHGSSNRWNFFLSQIF